VFNFRLLETIIEALFEIVLPQKAYGSANFERRAYYAAMKIYRWRSTTKFTSGNAIASSPLEWMAQSKGLQIPYTSREGWAATNPPKRAGLDAASVCKPEKKE
jgi:hypothetical protein